MSQDVLTKRREERQRELKQIMDSPRASHVFIVTPDRTCPMARQIQGTYPKNSPDIPELPHEGCSNPGGCMCRYEPFVDEVGP